MVFEGVRPVLHVPFADTSDQPIIESELADLASRMVDEGADIAKQHMRRRAPSTSRNYARWTHSSVNRRDWAHPLLAPDPAMQIEAASTSPGISRWNPT